MDCGRDCRISTSRASFASISVVVGSSKNGTSGSIASTAARITGRFSPHDSLQGIHVVLTGRNAPEALIEAADLVTDTTLVKHPFRTGIKRQPGVEF